MSEPRLKSRLWVQAALRALSVQGIFATVVRSGDEDAGAVLIKQNFQDGRFCVLSRRHDGAGRLVWHGGSGPEPVAEDKADAYIAREVERDYDLWVVEIEDKEGRLPPGEVLAPAANGF